MGEDQVLSASGRAHRVGLDEAQPRDGPLQARGLEQAARDRVAAKLIESGGWHKRAESSNETGLETSRGVDWLHGDGFGKLAAMTQGAPPACVTYSPLLPLALLLFSGLYLFALPYLSRGAR